MLCPVAAILSYIALQGPGAGPLFRFGDGHPLTWQRLVSALRDVLQEFGIDCSKYSGIVSELGPPPQQQQEGSKIH